MNTDADIIVIGAGIAGTSAAAALADFRRVLVLEQETQPGYHATGRSAATWAPYYGPAVIQQLTAASKISLSNPSDDMGTEAFTSPRGEMMLGLVGDEAEMEHHQALGMQPLSLAEARRYVPLVKDSVNSILYTDNMLSIDVDALHQAYIRKTKINAGSIKCNQKVTSLEYSDNNWVVETSTNTYTAPVVINAAGAWADHVASLAQITPVGLTPKRRSAALVPYAHGSTMHQWPMIFGAGERFYCTPFGNGLMISPADETPVEPHDVWPEELDLATGIDTFQQYIDHEVNTVQHQWAGLRTFSPDGNPVVGFDTTLPGFFWFAGQGGYGIQTAPAMSELCRSLISVNSGSKEVNAMLTVSDVQILKKELTPARF